MTATTTSATATSSDTINTLLGQVDDYVNALNALPSKDRLSQDTLDLIYSFAYTQIQHGRIKQAREYLALLLVYAPTDTRYLSAMAHCCEKDGHTDEAIQMYSLALYIAPQSCQLALALAESLLRRGATDAASQLFQQIVRIGTSPDDARYRFRAELWLQTLSRGGATQATRTGAAIA